MEFQQRRKEINRIVYATSIIYNNYIKNNTNQLVAVCVKNGDIMTAEESLKQGKTTKELLDKYGVEYIKREK